MSKSTNPRFHHEETSAQVSKAYNIIYRSMKSSFCSFLVRTVRKNCMKCRPVTCDEWQVVWIEIYKYKQCINYIHEFV